jgi:hypothetical protein
MIVQPRAGDDPETRFDLSEDDLILDDEVDEAIDAPPPVSPAMVATASELEAHVPNLDSEAASELELEAESELELEAESELELEAASELELEPVPELEVQPIPGLDEDKLEREPTEEDLAKESGADSDPEPSSGDPA